MANDVFLKKVYDQYLNTDYEYGVSNLNPKREISLDNASTEKDISQKIEDEIRRQVAEIKSQANDFLNFTAPKDNSAVPDVKVPSGNLLGMAKDTDKTKVPKIAGSVLDNTLPSSPLVDEIDDLIFQLSFIANLPRPKTKKPFDRIGKGTNPANVIAVPNGCALCQGADPELDAKAKKIKVPSPGETGLENEGEKGTGEIITSPVEEIVGAGNSLEDDDSNSDNENDGFPLGCLLQNLEILKTILEVLKILNTIKDGVMLTLTLGVPLIKLAARCAACWTCPPSLGEALQLVMEKISAILLGVAGELLQMLWDMLKFDCIDSMVMTLKDKILEILSGWQSFSGLWDSETWSMLGEDYADAINELKDNAKATQASIDEYSANDPIGKMTADLSNGWKNGLSNIGASWKNAGMTALTKLASPISSFMKETKRMADSIKALDDQQTV